MCASFFFRLSETNMESERLYTITNSLRAVVRETGVKTYVIIQCDRVDLFLNAEKWKKLQIYFPFINTEFESRYEDEYNLFDQEKLFTIAENLRALVRGDEAKTYVALECDETPLLLNSENWRRFKKYFPIICTEFKLRYDL